MSFIKNKGKKEKNMQEKKTKNKLKRSMDINY